MIASFKSYFSFSPKSYFSPKPEPKASSSAEVVSGMKPKEVPLAGYLLARAAMQQKVEGKKLQNLRAGHDSVQQVSELLPLGRANVNEDIRKAKDRHPDHPHLRLRHEASSEYHRLLGNKEQSARGTPSKEYGRRILAASSQHVETGVCDSFATSTTPLHAAKLADMKDKRAIVAQAMDLQVRHTWSETMPKGKREDGTPILHGKDVIMDGWCKENLAAFREDSRYARLDKNGNANGNIFHVDLLNHETGPEALKEVAKYKGLLEKNPAWKKDFNDQITAKAAYWETIGEEGNWNAQSIFHDEFLGKAGAVLHNGAKHVMDAKDVQKAVKYAAEESPLKKLFRTEAEQAKRQVVREQAQHVKHASMTEIKAMVVAQNLGSTNIRGAKADASKILASAKEMFPAPPSPS